MHAHLRCVLVALALAGAAMPAAADAASVPPPRGWSSDSRPGGLDGAVRCVAAYHGRLVFGGTFEAVGESPADHVGSWDGRRWEPLGEGLDGVVTHLVTHGEALIAAGLFLASGEDSVRRIARWDGVAWRALGDGLPSPVTAMLSDGDDLLVACYPVCEASARWRPCTPADELGLARWDGATWTWLSDEDDFAGVDVLTPARDLLLHYGSLVAAAPVRVQTGTGPMLYPAMIREGGRWLPFGPGTPEGTPNQKAFVTHLLDDGDGILAAGRFPGFTDPSGGASRLLRWDGATWTSVDPGVGGPVQTLERLDERIVLTSHLDGPQWSDPAKPPSHLLVREGTVWRTVVETDGRILGVGLVDGRLCLGGEFTSVGGVPARRVAIEEDGTWAAAAGIDGAYVAEPVIALAACGDDLFAQALFEAGSHEPPWYTFAVHSGVDWRRVGGPGGTVMRRDDNWVLPATDRIGATWEYRRGLAQHGGGLVVGGGDIESWDGIGWTRLGRSRLQKWSGDVWTLGSWRGLLVAGGRFDAIDEVSARAIAVRSADGWVALGEGLADTCGDVSEWECSQRHEDPWQRAVNRVRSIAELDGDLIAAGVFDRAGDTTAANIARWDGATWSPMGDGLNDLVTDTRVFRGELYAAGFFTGSGDTDAMNHIARWDGSAWRPVGSGADAPVLCLAVYNDKLVAGGLFRTAGDLEARHVAAWDGVGWLTLDSGVNGAVNDLEVHEGSLWAGGEFTEAGGATAFHLARWTEPLAGPELFTLPAERTLDSVVLRWGILAAAPDHGGFHVDREPLGRPYARITREPITGATEFTFVDDDPSQNRTTYRIVSVTRAGVEHVVAELTVEPAMGIRLALDMSRPNPFRTSGGAPARILYRLPAEGRVVVRVLDVAGRDVALLTDQDLPAGEYEATWDGRDAHGRTVSAGVYFARLDASGTTLTRKLVVLE